MKLVQFKWLASASILIVLELMTLSCVKKKLTDTKSSVASRRVSRYASQCMHGLNLSKLPTVSCRDFPTFPKYMLDDQQNVIAVDPYLKRVKDVCLNPDSAGNGSSLVSPRGECGAGTHGGFYEVLNEQNSPVVIAINCSLTSHKQTILNTIVYHPSSGKSCWFEGNGRDAFSLNLELGQAANLLNCVTCHRPNIFVQTPALYAEKIEKALNLDFISQIESKKNSNDLHEGDKPNTSFAVNLISNAVNFAGYVQRSRTKDYSEFSKISRGVPKNAPHYEPGLKLQKYSFVDFDDPIGNGVPPRILVANRPKLAKCTSCHVLGSDYFSARQSVSLFGLCEDPRLAGAVCYGLDYKGLQAKTGKTLHEIMFDVKVEIDEELKNALLDYANDCIGRNNQSRCEKEVIPYTKW